MIRKYVDVTEPDQRRQVWGGALSQDMKYLLYAEQDDIRAVQPKYTMRRLSIDTGQTIDMGSGVNPEWSLDSQWIAYVNLDGIYLMRNDGAQQQRLVQHDLRSSPELGDFAPSEPRPRWSPDSKSLVYHVCESSICHLYVFDLVNGSERKLLDNEGLNPYWRYP